MNSHCHTPGSTFWHQLTDSMLSANDQNVCLVRVVHCRRHRRRRRHARRHCSNSTPHQYANTQHVPLTYKAHHRRISFTFPFGRVKHVRKRNVCERTIENKSNRFCWAMPDIFDMVSIRQSTIMKIIETLLHNKHINNTIQHRIHTPHSALRTLLQRSKTNMTVPLLSPFNCTAWN